MTVMPNSEWLIKAHPILDFEFDRKKKVKFTFDGRELEGFEGEPIAVALQAAGIRTFRESHTLKRPRGFFCAVGKCASCSMIVNGVPNTRVCVAPLKEGMVVKTQKGVGELKIRG